MSIKSSSRFWEVALPIILGVVAFWIVVGLSPLMPTNIAWLSGQDPSQHYLGWAFFRYSPWSNPIGLNPNYGLELANAIAFTDSIPWMAFLFKPFSPLLPEPFQYIGLWVLLCFLLQAWFSWKLAGLITQDLVLRLFICGLLGVFAPPFLKRLGLHAALMGQFLILAALYFNLNTQNDKQSARTPHHTPTWGWLALLLLAALTNIYLLVMVFGLWLAYLGDRLLNRSITFFQVLKNILIVSGAIALCLWQTGYFVHSGTPIEAEGFGQYKINVLSLFDAGRYSYWLKAIAHPEDLEEGFVFLGAGLLALMLVALASKVRSTLTNQAAFNHHLSIKDWCTTAPMTSSQFGPMLWIVLACFTVFALSNQISIGPWTWTYPLPESLLQWAGILRSSARFFWPVYYAIVFALLRWVATHFLRKQAVVLLGIALLIQIVDTSAGWLSLRHTFAQLNTQPAALALSGPFWNAAGKRYQKVVLLPVRSGQTQEHWQALSYFASYHHMGTNAVYLGRRADPAKVAQFNQTTLAKLKSAELAPDTLYILSDTPQYQQWLARQPIARDTCVFSTHGLIALGPHWADCSLAHE